jgi:hypothetical protein
MGREKRSFGMRIDADLYAQLEKQAKREGRSPANLGEVLLTWAFKQLHLAGNSVTLLDLNVSSPVHSSPKVREEVAEILSKKK